MPLKFMPDVSLYPEPYAVDYSGLLNEINKLEILSSAQLQTEYLRRWLDYLSYLDKTTVSELRRCSIIDCGFRKAGQRVEIMQKHIFFGDVDLFVHFRTDDALKLIAEGVVSGEEGDLSCLDFIDDNRVISWTPIERMVTRDEITSEPIIVVPFHNYHFLFLVIDGNHRVTYHVQNNIETINSLMLHPQTLVDRNLFPSEFDKAIYIFLEETYALYQARCRQSLTEQQMMELIQSTYTYKKHIARG